MSVTKVIISAQLTESRPGPSDHNNNDDAHRLCLPLPHHPAPLAPCLLAPHHLVAHDDDYVDNDDDYVDDDDDLDDDADDDFGH